MLDNLIVSATFLDRKTAWRETSMSNRTGTMWPDTWPPRNLRVSYQDIQWQTNMITFYIFGTAHLSMGTILITSCKGHHQMACHQCQSDNGKKWTEEENDIIKYNQHKTSSPWSSSCWFSNISMHVFRKTPRRIPRARAMDLAS